jgi:hypothetical protein
MRKVLVTSCICQPIPDRSYDWCAYPEGEEEAGNYGYGATEVEAVLDYLANCNEGEKEERWARIRAEMRS